MDISKKSLCFLLRFLFGEWIAILLLVFAQDSVAFLQMTKTLCIFLSPFPIVMNKK